MGQLVSDTGNFLVDGTKIRDWLLRNLRKRNESETRDYLAFYFVSLLSSGKDELIKRYVSLYHSKALSYVSLYLSKALSIQFFALFVEIVFRKSMKGCHRKRSIASSLLKFGTFFIFPCRKLRKLAGNVKAVQNSSIKAMYSGNFWAPEKSSRQGIWSVRSVLC